ncbi:MAG TPA: lipopolysaccharide kinase InaA family protein, partial [Flavobacterium sp.]|nr:lipopolysaccharide kinase InaA family protein [Flavobacterium sp.]
MTIKLMFSKAVSNSREVLYFIKNFNSEGILFGDGQRNKIKLFELEGKTINIKSFKIPHLINKIAYKYFRKSKARRSFEYATTLLEKGIGTPQPIAYFENYDVVGLKESYYVSEHLQCDLTYRELVEIPDFPDNENILRQFTQFSFGLHEKGIEFLDHSPGNTLIKKNADGNYDFFLVDLNRMNFHDSMDFDSRMKNLSHLTPKKEMIAVMSNEYSKLYTS